MATYKGWRIYHIGDRKWTASKGRVYLRAASEAKLKKAIDRYIGR